MIHLTAAPRKLLTKSWTFLFCMLVQFRWVLYIHHRWNFVMFSCHGNTIGFLYYWRLLPGYNFLMILFGQ
ncbi:hypothetical protein BO82DRAFT_199149 [Aspergillus uvarum CBS 121591]|uniref:Uncharacterized protein n=1 Tax=Aspergillus uvarum CBS 121591 TaxID=1448315 RepID=A0A319DAP4_9EURO|nr:hypothetical protein BO82DRAFT_199149 [Aspergillus uvarum CBS 121591]PYH85088.1 hypothetical protein BO82DRAFT_199149 [Aspergillus uvarum CBS 121591]